MTHNWQANLRWMPRGRATGVGGTPGVGYRPAEAADAPFIFHSWLRTYRRSHLARAMPEREFMLTHHAIAERLLGRGRCVVVHPEGDPAVILGWVLREAGAPVLHYVYVKGALRGHGLGRGLVAEAGPWPAGWRYTHRTALGGPLAIGGVYNPYLL